MAKGTVGLRAADGSTVSHVREALAGGSHLVEHVATALRTVVGYGFASVTAAAGLPNVSAMVTAGATHAFVTVESGGGDLRWRSDGASPAATPSTNANAGLLCPAGSAVEIALADLTQVKVIATTGTAVIVVEYGKYDA